MSGWQPIDSAPKDQRILLYRPTAPSSAQVQGGRWNADEYARKPRPYWAFDNWHIGKPEARRNAPTHWMPLPAPPEVKP